MNVSASPKPASGPVFGLTCPILMTCDWASTGKTRRTAGAAITPKPVLTSARRDIVFTSLISALPCCVSLFLARKSFQVSFVTLILPCSLHRHIECDRCRNPTPLKREITTGQPDPPVRPGGLWAHEREIPCGRYEPVRYVF